MAIIINHRFINRLTSTEGIKKVNFIIIGTFNPGLPDITKLDSLEKKQFEIIQNTEKFKKFNQVRNFYDRPQNRFWKIMDFINDPGFYSTNSLEDKNYDGLKFYSCMDREKVFQRQIEFCKRKGIIITDIVKSIKPNSFHNIYDNFPDTAIENASPEWNLDDIIEVIIKLKPKKVLINFNTNSNSIPFICNQITAIKDLFPKLEISSLKSSSGNAAFTYTELIKDWVPNFI